MILHLWRVLAWPAPYDTHKSWGLLLCTGRRDSFPRQYGVDGGILHQDADNEVASFWHRLFDAVFGCGQNACGGCGLEADNII